MTIETKRKCPANKATCDATDQPPCIYSKESLCDYPHASVSSQPMTEERRQELCRNYGISSWDNVFDSFQLRPGAEESFRAFCEFVADPYARPLLICYGGAGCGKTHLLEAVVREWASHGRKARIQQFVDVLDALRSAMRDKVDSWRYDNLLQAYCHKVPYILWDDVGMGAKGMRRIVEDSTGKKHEEIIMGDWEASLLEQVVVSRCRADVRLPTVLVTNLDISALPERVVSRARDKSLARLVFNAADDFRPTIKDGNLNVKSDASGLCRTGSD